MCVWTDQQGFTRLTFLTGVSVCTREQLEQLDSWEVLDVETVMFGKDVAQLAKQALRLSATSGDGDSPGGMWPSYCLPPASGVAEARTGKDVGQLERVWLERSR